MAPQPYRLDSNVLIRWVQPNDPDYAVVELALASLSACGAILCYTSQNLAEYWNACTRPLNRNGYGMSPQEADRRVRPFGSALPVGLQSRDCIAEDAGLNLSPGSPGIVIPRSREAGLRRGICLLLLLPEPRRERRRADPSPPQKTRGIRVTVLVQSVIPLVRSLDPRPRFRGSPEKQVTLGRRPPPQPAGRRYDATLRCPPANRFIFNPPPCCGKLLFASFPYAFRRPLPATQALHWPSKICAPGSLALLGAPVSLWFVLFRLLQGRAATEIIRANCSRARRFL
jgi:hypothetical protein